MSWVGEREITWYFDHKIQLALAQELLLTEFGGIVIRLLALC